MRLHRIYEVGSALLEPSTERMFSVLWDEALDVGVPEGAVIMLWRSELAGWYAASAGHPVVMTLSYWAYFDWAQDTSEAEPVAIRPTTDLRRVHAFDPAPPSLTTEARTGILSAQRQLWTKYVTDPARAEYQYFPRPCASAEMAWSSAGGEFCDFETRLIGHLARLDAFGVHYRPLSGPRPGQMRMWPALEPSHVS